MANERVKTIAWRALAVVMAIPAIFFTVFGVLIIYAVLMFEGEGSLGHVGMVIGAIVYPILAIIFIALTLFAWRRSARKA